MKTKIIIGTLIICLLPLSYALSQDNKTIEGEIGVTGVWFDLHGKEGGKAKFTEYRDLREDGAHRRHDRRWKEPCHDDEDRRGQQRVFDEVLSGFIGSQAAKECEDVWCPHGSLLVHLYFFMLKHRVR